MLFAQSILSLDWCMQGEQHPVVRVFGTTPSGQSSLIHIHQLYPYFYCDLPPLPPPTSASSSTTTYWEEEFFPKLRETLCSLLGHSDQSVRGISLVHDKIDMYGFQEPNSYCKIELLDPGHVKRCFEHIVTEMRLRAYDAHIGFIPQVMRDLNLFGMSQITCSEYAFRYPMRGGGAAPQQLGGAVRWSEEMTPPPRVHFAPSATPEYGYSGVSAYAERPGRTSICDLELDVLARDVVVIATAAAADRLDSVAQQNGIGFVKSLIPWWDAEEKRRTALGLSFDHRPEPENASPEFRCPDPFHYRERLEEGMGRLGGVYPGQQQEKSSGEEGVSGSNVHSQDTLEVICMLEEMREPRCIPPEEEFSPSDLTDADLLQQQHNHGQDDQVADSVEDNNDDEDEEDEEEHAACATWKDISQSQRYFLHEEEDGAAAVEDDHQQAHSASTASPRPSPVKIAAVKAAAGSVVAGSRGSVELHYGEHRHFVQVRGQTGSAASTSSSWYEPRQPAPLPATTTTTTKQRTRPRVSQLSQVGDSLLMATPANPQAVGKGNKALRTALQKDGDNDGDPDQQARLVGGLCIMSLDCYARTTNGLLPNPAEDAITAIFYVFHDTSQPPQDSSSAAAMTGEEGILCVATPFSSSSSSNVTEFASESDLLAGFVRLVRAKNVDVFLAWELQRDSLGYILKRAKALGKSNFARDLSKVPFGPQDPRHDRASSLLDDHSGFWIPGRIIVNLWKLIKHEVKLSMYSLEHAMQHVLGGKLPVLTPAEQNLWFSASNHHGRRTLLFANYVHRCDGAYRIADHFNLFGRGSEVCRFLGLDLFSSLTRGSQYQVESLLLRVSHGEQYIVLSPTRAQVAHQKTLECCALLFEPESKFYAHPVCIFDFRSLYPSVVIAHNICYSTCVGRINLKSGGGGFFLPGLGVDPRFSPGAFTLEDIGFISPHGVCFLSKKKRVGVLPRMLDEILKTRVMVKQSIAGEEHSTARKRLIEARQFGLKMIANLTYGYTSASFSGRMPCVEIADSIVETGRASLEFAIRGMNHLAKAHGNNSLQRRVVYGDTDSLFLHLMGASLGEARELGAEYAAVVSQKFPRPIKLQFEKIYFPCVLQVKKRYVGLKFAATAGGGGGVAQAEERGALDAKGIELVRRDGCPAVVKTLELVLKELFTSRDLSKVKLTLLWQIDRIFQGSVSLSNFILTGRVKFGSYAKDAAGGGGAAAASTGHYPPAAVVGDKLFRRDTQAKPMYKQRVAYLVACGPPQSRLVDLVVDPLELMDKDLRVNLAHYIFKLVLPAVNRVLLVCLDGNEAELNAWYANIEQSRNLWGGFRQVQIRSHGGGNFAGGRGGNFAGGRGSIANMFTTQQHCVLCGKRGVGGGGGAVLCEACGEDLQRARLVGEVVSRQTADTARQCLRTCAACILHRTQTVPTSSAEVHALGESACVNLDCEDLYNRVRALDRVRKNLALFDQIGM